MTDLCDTIPPRRLSRIKTFSDAVELARVIAGGDDAGIAERLYQRAMQQGAAK